LLINFKFVILDVDGTIFDSKKKYRKILKWMSDLGFNFLLNRFYSSMLDNNYSKSLYILKKKIYNLIYIFFERINIEKPRTFKGVKTFLKELKRKKIKIFASTNSSVIDTEEKMKQSDIFKFFELILGRESYKVNHISLFAKYLNIDLKEFCSQAIYIGDGPIDIMLAKRNGIYSIGITNTIGNKLLKELGANKIIDKITKAC